MAERRKFKLHIMTNDVHTPPPPTMTHLSCLLSAPLSPGWLALSTLDLAAAFLCYRSREISSNFRLWLLVGCFVSSRSQFKCYLLRKAFRDPHPEWSLPPALSITTPCFTLAVTLHDPSAMSSCPVLPFTVMLYQVSWEGRK